MSDWDQYLQLFRNAGEAKARGEASVCYHCVPRPVRNIVKPLFFKRRETLEPALEKRDLLKAYYKDDVSRLADLLDRDLTHWLD